MRTAVTRAVGPALADCELTFLPRRPIDVARAAAEHGGYEAALRGLGARVVSLPPLRDHPDSPFVEDAAVVLDEVAIVTTLGTPARRGEAESVAEALSLFRRLARLDAPPASLEGGDVLRVERTLYVGLSTRTNREGVAALTRIVDPLGYAVRPVAVTGCLHLKTGCTRAGSGVLVGNAAWVDRSAFVGFEWIEVDESEPFGGNVLTLDDTLLVSASFPRTRERLEARGFRTAAVAIGELEKAEAGATCLSLVFEA